MTFSAVARKEGRMNLKIHSVTGAKSAAITAKITIGP
jgi:hypothetical protein